MSQGLEHELARLLDDLCKEWGFCLPPDDRRRISQVDSMTAHGFAKLILAAEGMDPALEVSWARRIAARFVDRFGAATVSAQDPRI